MERFIIGTGRCGSTLLSTMMTHHPDVLVVSEFMNSIRPVDLGDAPISGDEFAARLTLPNPILDLVFHRGIKPKEILHDMGEEEKTAASIPAILLAMLPTISSTPDELYRESLATVRSFPLQTLAWHNLMYFEWLRTKLGKKLWLERSGASIEILPEIVRMYPQARFVHIHRDGPEAALSMVEHDYFRLYASFHYDPLTREELAQTELAGKPVSASDPISQRMTTRLPSYEQFGAFWSHQIAVGFPELAKMGAEKLLTVRFEDLMATPVQVIARIAAFFDLPDSPGWIDNAIGLVENSPKTRLHRLADEDRAALERGCRMGQYYLGRAARPPGFDHAFQLLYDAAAHAGGT